MLLTKDSVFFNQNLIMSSMADAVFFKSGSLAKRFYYTPNKLKDRIVAVTDMRTGVVYCVV